MTGKATVPPREACSIDRVKVVMLFASPVNGKWSYRRAGFEFGKEPVELTFRELAPTPAQAFDNLILIASDPHLRVTLTDHDGNEQVLNDGQGNPDPAAIAELEAARSALRSTAN